MRKGLCAILLVIGLAGAVYGDIRQGAVLFLMIQPGARAAGMGQAFSALADDPTATYWNPAGLAIYPLASKWHEIEIPEGDTLYSLAVIKTGGLATNYKNYDLYIVTNRGLFKLTEKRGWINYEQIEAEEGDKLSDLLLRLLPYMDKNEITSRIMPNLLKINRLDSTTADPELLAGQRIKVPYEVILGAQPTCIISGSHNSLYIGTKNGLFVRDGERWERLGESGGPGKREITCVYEDDEGGLWVGTNDGLFARRGTRWYHYTTSDGLPSMKITDIFVKASKYVWVGTDMGAGYFDGIQWKRTYQYSPPPGANWGSIVDSLFSPITKDKRELFIQEILAANRQDNPSSPVPSTVEIPFTMPFESSITAVYGDKTGATWFGTEYGIIRFVSGRWYFYGYSAEKIKEDTDIASFLKTKFPNLKESELNKLVLQTQIFNRLNTTEVKAGQEIFYPSSPASGYIYRIGEGATGELLFGTSYGTLTFKNGLFKYYTHNDLHTTPVATITKRGSEVWFNTKNRVSVYSRGKRWLSLMHVKWLPELANDLYYEYFTGNFYLEGWGTFGTAVTFLSMGQNEWRDEQGNLLGTFTSYDMAFTLSYGTSFTDWLRFGLNLKFIYSHLAEVGAGRERGKGIATDFAVDAGIHSDTPVPGLKWAAVVQNIGPNISYIDAAQSDPLPRNLKLGLAFTPVGQDEALIRSEYNRFTLALDINKDLIGIGEKKFKEELDDIIGNVGIEYSYADFIMLRAGFVRDKYIPPDGYYFTFGAGLRYANFQFDFAHIPKKEDLTLSGTTRVSLTVNF